VLLRAAVLNEGKQTQPEFCILCSFTYISDKSERKEKKEHISDTVACSYMIASGFNDVVYENLM
jgi:hypothetical protein